MTYKKKVTATQAAQDDMRALIQRIDPVVLLGGSLGAVAAAGGLTPPLTAILASFGKNTDAFNLWKSVAELGSPALTVADWLGLLGSNSTTTTNPKTYALAASGAFEAMLMLELVKNPATITAIGNAISGVAGSAKGLLATL